jgi:hypothetical protein
MVEKIAEEERYSNRNLATPICEELPLRSSKNYNWGQPCPALPAEGSRFYNHGMLWIQHNQYGVNNIGSYIWRFSMRIDWCYDGYRVTSISPPQPAATLRLPCAGWEYNGVTSQQQGTTMETDGCTEYRQQQGALPTPKLWCVQRATHGYL